MKYSFDSNFYKQKGLLRIIKSVRKSFFLRNKSTYTYICIWEFIQTINYYLRRTMCFCFSIIIWNKSVFEMMKWEIFFLFYNNNSYLANSPITLLGMFPFKCWYFRFTFTKFLFSVSVYIFWIFFFFAPFCYAKRNFS